ncbi:type II secretion system F family protein [Aeromonas veronii]
MNYFYFVILIACVIFIIIDFNKRNSVLYKYHSHKKTTFKLTLSDFVYMVVNMLYQISLVKSSHDKLLSVGITVKNARNYIIMTSMYSFVISSLVLGWLTKNGFLSFFLSLLIAFFIVHFLCRARILKIKRKREDVSVMMLTILKMCIGSGASIDNALEVCANKVRDVEPSTSYFIELYISQKNNIGYQKATKQLTDNWSCSAVHKVFDSIPMFVRDGGDLYSFIGSEIERFLEKRAHKTEEKVAKLSSKMTIPMILFIMFPSFALMVGPAVALSIGVISGASR